MLKNMGTAISTCVDLTSNEYILKFVEKEPISLNDPFWNRFLAFNITLPTTSNDQLTLDTSIEPFCQKLLINNLKSGNVGTLIQIFLTKAAELLAATNTDDSLFSWQTFNALFTIRCIMKYLIEVIVEEQFIEHIEMKNGCGNQLEIFIGSLVGILVDVPLKTFTYAIHLECATCLLVLLSVQLHSSKRAEQSTIYRLIMKGKHSIHAPLLVKSLLQNFVEQQKMPSIYGTNQSHNSLVMGLAAGLWSMITFNKKSTESVEVLSDNNSHIEAPLARQSLLLILVLVNHCTTQNNPYRQSLFTCANSLDNTPTMPTKTPSLFKIDYFSLFTAICKRANEDATTLLLYLLLHRNSSFKTHVLNYADLDQLIIPILKTLYHAPNSNSHHIYMSLIVLLILSEDDGFNRSVHEMKLKGVTWYTERNISEVSLGGLLVLVVIRTIQYNMLKMRDKYLHTNCLAALANMSAQFRDLHPYVSQRLVSLFETLAKKHQRLQQRLDSENHASSPQDTSVLVVTENVDSEQDLEVLEEVLRMVLEIFNSCLSNQLVNNPNLVYTLLYKKEVFEPYRNNPVFQDVIQNIEVVIEYFSQQLSTKAQQYEVDFHQVLQVILQGAKSWPKEKLTKFPELKFKYVEEDQPEEFFIPYVWSLVSQQSVLNWTTDGSPLLNTVC